MKKNLASFLSPPGLCCLGTEFQINESLMELFLYYFTYMSLLPRLLSTYRQKYALNVVLVVVVVICHDPSLHLKVTIPKG